MVNHFFCGQVNSFADAGILTAAADIGHGLITSLSVGAGLLL